MDSDRFRISVCVYMYAFSVRAIKCATNKSDAERISENSPNFACLLSILSIIRF